jgi:ubiquinone/menaquinone biosynthesis C-methylase UbiE
MVFQRMSDQSPRTERTVPPKHLRVKVGPFSDAGLFQRTGDEMAAEIIDLCNIPPDASVLEVGCGCERLSCAFGEYLNSIGSYEGFDVSADMIAWCQCHLQTRLPNSRFTWVDVHSPDQNPDGHIEGAAFTFPCSDGKFDAAVVSSVFTHIMPDEIERYVSELVRVLKPGGRCFISAFLFDEEAEAAVANKTTVFDFRYPVGPCLTFDREHPEAGIASHKDWLLGLLDRFGFEVNTIRNGTWRFVRSYKVSQDYVVTTKRPGVGI